MSQRARALLVSAKAAVVVDWRLVRQARCGIGSVSEVVYMIPRQGARMPGRPLQRENRRGVKLALVYGSLTFIAVLAKWCGSRCDGQAGWMNGDGTVLMLPRPRREVEKLSSEMGELS